MIAIARAGGRAGPGAGAVRGGNGRAPGFGRAAGSWSDLTRDAPRPGKNVSVTVFPDYGVSVAPTASFDHRQLFEIFDQNPQAAGPTPGGPTPARAAPPRPARARVPTGAPAADRLSSVVAGRVLGSSWPLPFSPLQNGPRPARLFEIFEQTP